MILPAERQRGLAVRVKMDSQASINAAGFTIVGTPSFSNNGMVFDGTTNYLTANPKTFESNNFQTTGFTIRWKAKIASADLASSYRIIADTSTADPNINDGFFAFYDNRGGANPTNGINVNVATVTSGNRNVLSSNVITFDVFDEWCAVYNGSTFVLYKNGVLQSSTNSVSGTGNYTPRNTVAAIGALTDGTGTKFKGTMQFLETWTVGLTAQEVLDLYNNATFTYPNKAVLDLPMDMASYDPTATKSLDRSGKGNNASYTAGATAPTKLATEGFSFDGGDFFNLGTSTALNSFFNSSFSVSCWVQTSYLANRQGIISKEAAGGSDRFYLGISETNGRIITFWRVDGTTYFEATLGTTNTSTGTWQHIVLTANRSGSATGYINGVAESTPQDMSTSSGLTFSNSNNAVIGGRNEGIVSFLNGSLAEVSVFPLVLTPLQVLDLYLTTKNKLTKV